MSRPKLTAFPFAFVVPVVAAFLMSLASQGKAMGDPQSDLGPFFQNLFRVQIDGSAPIERGAGGIDRNKPPRQPEIKRALRRVPGAPIRNSSKSLDCDDFVIQGYEEWLMGKKKAPELYREWNAKGQGLPIPGMHWPSFWQWNSPVYAHVKTVRRKFLSLSFRRATVYVAVLSDTVNINTIINQEQKRFKRVALNRVLALNNGYGARYRWLYEGQIYPEEIELISTQDCKSFKIYEFKIKKL